MLASLRAVYRQTGTAAPTIVSATDPVAAIQAFTLSPPDSLSRSGVGSYLLECGDEFLGQDFGTQIANGCKSFVGVFINTSQVAKSAIAFVEDLGSIRVNTFDSLGDPVDLEGQLTLFLDIYSV